MSETNETLADVLAEMRKRKEMLEEAIWSAPIDSPTDGMKAQVEVLDEFIDRIEAAAKYPKAQSLDADKLTGKNISGLVTDLRQIAKYHYARGNIEQGQFARVMADRIETAWKREVDKLNSVIQAQRSAFDAEQDRQRRAAPGDAAAMREALRDIVALELSGSYLPVHMAKRMAEVARAALAAPARNCDVGTAEDQFERWQAFCNKYDDDCTACPCDDNICASFASCFSKWAQMPYNEKGGAS